MSVAMLVLGIAVNIAMFTVANTALFKGFSEVRENDRILLTGAGLMARSVFNVYTANIGVNPTNVLSMSMYVAPESYPGNAEQISFYQRLSARLQSVPGVQSVAIASVAPTDRRAEWMEQVAIGQRGVNDFPRIDAAAVPFRHNMSASGDRTSPR